MTEEPAAGIPPEDRLRRAFDAYNRQDADALLGMVSDDLSWATDRTLLHGKQELRSYWDRQWQRIRTHDDVVHIELVSELSYNVTLEQTVYSIRGELLSTGCFKYEFVVEDGLIRQLVSIEGIHEQPRPMPVE